MECHPVWVLNKHEVVKRSALAAEAIHGWSLFGCYSVQIIISSDHFPLCKNGKNIGMIPLWASGTPVALQTLDVFYRGGFGREKARWVAKRFSRRYLGQIAGGEEAHVPLLL